MILECPHCFLKVGVNSDGICPNCRNDVNDESKIDTSKKAFKLLPNMKIPSVCCLCSSHTDQMVHIKDVTSVNVQGEEANSNDLFGLLGLIFVPFGWLISLITLGFLMDQSGPKRDVKVVTYQLPKCDGCTQDEIKIIESNPMKNTMRVLVDKKFIEQLITLNES